MCIVYFLHWVLIHSHPSCSYLIFLYQHSLPLFCLSVLPFIFSVAAVLCYPISLLISSFSSATCCWMFPWIFLSTKLCFLHLHHKKLCAPLQLLVPYSPAPSCPIPDVWLMVALLLVPSFLLGMWVTFWPKVPSAINALENNTHPTNSAAGILCLLSYLRH